MPKLPFVSGSGEHPRAKLSQAQIETLANHAGVNDIQHWGTDVQEIVDSHLAWHWADFSGDTTPMHKYYVTAAKKLRDAAVYIERGPKSEHKDVQDYGRIGFDSQRALPDDPNLVRLKHILRFAANNFDRADDWLTAVELPTRSGAQADKRLDRLVCLCADLFEKYGIAPNEYYSDQRGGHDTAFIRFMNELYAALPPEVQTVKTWGSSGPLTSIIRRVLPEWRQRRLDRQERGDGG